jgi:uncharacterized membrane protein YphA (DoxX/SURF4 family)
MTKGAIWWLLLIGRIAVGVTFIYSGYAKLSEPWLQFVVSLESFKILPDAWLEPIARTMPWLEVLLGVAILTGILARWFLLIATLLLVVFTGAGVSAYARGLAVDCGCFGSGGDPIGPKWFAEHGAMVAFAVAVTVGAFLVRRPRSPLPAESRHGVAATPDIA